MSRSFYYNLPIFRDCYFHAFGHLYHNVCTLTSTQNTLLFPAEKSDDQKNNRSQEKAGKGDDQKSISNHSPLASSAAIPSPNSATNGSATTEAAASPQPTPQPAPPSASLSSNSGVSPGPSGGGGGSGERGVKGAAAGTASLSGGGNNLRKFYVSIEDIDRMICRSSSRYAGNWV